MVYKAVILKVLHIVTPFSLVYPFCDMLYIVLIFDNPKPISLSRFQDGRTGDSKMAHESRSGDVVRGYYRLLDADNKVRTVRYTASDAAGFQAQVERTRV